jgi:hypothetical protein
MVLTDRWNINANALSGFQNACTVFYGYRLSINFASYHERAPIVRYLMDRIFRVAAFRNVTEGKPVLSAQATWWKWN